MDIFLLYNDYGGYMRLDNKGFTLVEVIAVVAIITILSVVVVPSVLNSINNGKEKSYEVLVGNIKIAAKELYEEVYANSLLGDSSKLYQYDYVDNVSDNESNIKKRDFITINYNSIENYYSIKTNLQTLVSNGFLSGSSDGKKQKVILNVREDNANMGNCKIEIVKNVNSSSNKVSYNVFAINEIENSNGKNICPTRYEYDKGVS